MLVNALKTFFTQSQINAIAVLFVFCLTMVCTRAFRDKLPQDHGRQFAVNGELSKGKARGAGLIFVICMVVTALLFVELSAEFLIYAVLIIAAMLSGYLDDASDKPWNEYKKGLIDLLIAVATAAAFIIFDTTDISVLSFGIHIPAVLYGILCVVLVWTSINVTNCTDGVDGLSSTVYAVTAGTVLLAFGDVMGSYAQLVIISIGAVAAYVWKNVSPSEIMMGDAGSRALGYLLALFAIKSHHPFAFLLTSFVFIFDGGLGIAKISLKRFLHIQILKNTRTPLHDQARKVNGWSDAQVVLRFAEVQAAASLVLLLLLG